jgi:hypothetical protein
MNRDYDTGIHDNVQFFIGTEVEHTPAFGMRTLFITGVQPVDEIAYHFNKHLDGIEHIFFGANHSFNPQTPEEWDQWQDMIQFFLEKDSLTKLRNCILSLYFME